MDPLCLSDAITELTLLKLSDLYVNLWRLLLEVGPELTLSKFALFFSVICVIA